MSAVMESDGLTEIREGLVWPAADDVAFKHIRMYVPLLHFAASQAKERRVAVQAGGNAGMYPVVLAQMFDEVITFEPEPLNYQCLVQNIANFPNVRAIEGVVGNRRTPVGLKEVKGLDDGKICVNTGAFKVDGSGTIPQYKIDDLDLPTLDFLQLDVEGFEVNALKGGEKTITKYSPVIMLESFNHGDDAGPFLEGLGYRRLVKGAYDHVYVRHHVP